MQVQMLRDSQKMFLQSFMSKGILNTREVKDLYHNVCTRYNEDEDEAGLANFVVAINQQLKPFNLDIKKGISEDTGTSHYVLVNTVSTEMTLKATDYASHELEFFKKLVEAIVMADNGHISSIDAVNLADEVKERKVKKDEAEQLLSRLAEEKWIVLSLGSVSLSTRSILELEPYIFDQYEGAATLCNMCNKICLRGQSCNSCDVKLHLHCASKFFEKQTTPKCPGANCKVPWPHDIPCRKKKDEQGATQEPTQEASSSTPQTRKRRR